MSGIIVQNILNQVNQLPNSASIKKLLFYKLEMELNASRCIIDGPHVPYKAIDDTIHNFGDPIPEPEVVPVPTVEYEPQINNAQEEPKVEESSNANV